MDDVFDLHKLRKNWARAAPEASVSPAPSLVGVRAARDPLREAAQALALLEQASLDRFPHGDLAIRAFIMELRSAFERLTESPGAEAPEATPAHGPVDGTAEGPAPSPDDAIATLLRDLDGFEELLEVYFMKESAPPGSRSRW